MSRPPLPLNQITRAAVHKRAQRAVPLNGAKCSKCSCSIGLARHHEDYSKPTTVDLLCAKCHRQHHDLLPMVACQVCGTAFQPSRTRRSTLCGSQDCRRENGRLSAAKRWTTERTDSDKSVTG